MKTMLAAFLPGNSSVELREVPVPTPGINQVLIKMKSSGICGSDVHYIYHQHRGTAAAPDKPLYQGFINGHEPCGQIIETGAGCRHFKAGDRVLVYHISGCGFAPTAAAVFLSPAPERAKRPMAGSAMAAMQNIYWRRKKTLFICRMR